MLIGNSLRYIYRAIEATEFYRLHRLWVGISLRPRNHREQIHLRRTDQLAPEVRVRDRVRAGVRINWPLQLGLGQVLGLGLGSIDPCS